MNSPAEFIPTGRFGDDVAAFREIKIVKQQERVIVPDRRLQLLRRIEIAQSEVGRLNKLLDEIRADVLHLTTT